MAVYVITLDDQVSAPAQQASAAVRGLADAMRGLQSSMGGVTQAVRGVAPAMQSMAGATSQNNAQLVTTSAVASAVPPQFLAIKEAAEGTIDVIKRVGGALFDLSVRAIQLADTRNQLRASFDAITNGGGGAAIDALTALADRLPFATSRVMAWGQAMAAAGFKGDALARSVEAIASGEAILKSGAAAVENVLAKLSVKDQAGGLLNPKSLEKFGFKLTQAGLSVEDLATQLGIPSKKLETIGVSADRMGKAIQDAVINKGKGPVSELRNSLEGIGVELEKGIGFNALFKDVLPAIKPFMAELRLLASEFFKGSTAATAAKGVITAVFTTLFQLATRAVRAIHIGFLEAAVFLLQVAVAAAPAVNAVRRFVAQHGGINLLVTALKGVAIVLGLVAVAAVIALSPFIIMGAAFMAVAGVVVFAVGWIAENVGAAVLAIRSWASSAYAAASDFIGGLVAGIESGVGRVIDAAKNLASGAVRAVREALDSHSPSRVMMGVGIDTASGMAEGIETGSTRVADASRELASVATVNAGSRGPRSGRGAGGTINIRAELHVDNHGDALELTEEKLAEMLERAARRAGIAPELAA